MALRGRCCGNARECVFPLASSPKLVRIRPSPRASGSRRFSSGTDAFLRVVNGECSSHGGRVRGCACECSFLLATKFGSPPVIGTSVELGLGRSAGRGAEVAPRSCGEGAAPLPRVWPSHLVLLILVLVLILIIKTS